MAHRDARFDAPSFVWLAKDESVQFASAREAATTTLQSIAGTFGLERAALASVETTSIDDSGRGAIIARTTQRVAGVEVFRGGLAIAMTRAFEPVSASGFLARSITDAARPFTRTRLDAVSDAYRALVGQPAAFRPIAVQSDDDGDGGGDYQHFTRRASRRPRA